MPSGLPGGGVLLLMLVVLLLWGATGFYRVLPSEQGVVLRFGEYVRTTKAGLHYHLPYPIESVRIPNVTRENREELGFRTSAQTRYRPSEVSDVSVESLMLTGDENIVDTDFSVTWDISDGPKYLFNLRDPDGTVRIAAESAMREVVGKTPIQRVLTEGRGEIEQQTHETLQDLLDEYDAGINIKRVQLLKVDPPKPVIDSFNDVQRARADRERLRNASEGYRNSIIPDARGRAEEMIQEARGYREAEVNRARGEAGRFVSVLKAYRMARGVTARRMYLETMESILAGVKKILMDPSSQKGGVVPYLPLSQLPGGSGK